jgi:hypothetical protein
MASINAGVQSHAFVDCNGVNSKVVQRHVRAGERLPDVESAQKLRIVSEGTVKKFHYPNGALLIIDYDFAGQIKSLKTDGTPQIYRSGLSAEDRLISITRSEDGYVVSMSSDLQRIETEYDSLHIDHATGKITASSRDRAISFNPGNGEQGVTTGNLEILFRKNGADSFVTKYEDGTALIIESRNANGYLPGFGTVARLEIRCPAGGSVVLSSESGGKLVQTVTTPGKRQTRQSLMGSIAEHAELYLRCNQMALEWGRDKTDALTYKVVRYSRFAGIRVPNIFDLVRKVGLSGRCG